jgi:hypothetical protein
MIKALSQYLVTIGTEQDQPVIDTDKLEKLIRGEIPAELHSIVMVDETDGLDNSAIVWIYIVEPKSGDGDGLYAFVDRARAEDYASRFHDAVVHEEMLMKDSAAAQFLIDTSGDDPEPEDAGNQKGTS